LLPDVSSIALKKVSKQQEVSVNWSMPARKFFSLTLLSHGVYAGEEIFFSHSLKSWGRKRGLAFRIILNPPAITSIRKIEWFTIYQMTIRILFILVFPFAISFRIFCSPWYYRPKE